MSSYIVIVSFSANILLDKDFTPKIGDFGLARYGPENGVTCQTMNTTKAYGTLPYLPKEFLRSFKLSVKVDVYSFGIVSCLSHKFINTVTLSARSYFTQYIMISPCLPILFTK